MQDNQLSWASKDWAAHLGCDGRRIPHLRKWLNKNFIVDIAQDEITKKYFFQILKYHKSPSGVVSYFPCISSDHFFSDIECVIKYANTSLIPRLELTSIRANMYGVPPRVLQMLHVNEKQK